MATGEIRESTDAAGLAALISRASAETGGRGLPPVERWNPPFCGDIDMEIRADGTWFYMGTPIGRAPLVRLFSTVLRRDEDGKTYLVTPVEKVGIRVEDAPFVATDVTAADGTLTFTTNVGDSVTADADHPIRVEYSPDGTPRPYVMVRRGLEALIDRKTFYRLAEIATPAEWQGEAWLGLTSAGEFFPLIPMREMPK